MFDINFKLFFIRFSIHKVAYLTANLEPYTKTKL